MRFVWTIWYGLVSGALAMGSVSALLSIWRGLFNHLGTHFSFADVLVAILTGVGVGIVVALIGAILGMVGGTVVAITRLERFATAVLTGIGLVVVLVIGVNSADFSQYDTINPATYNLVRGAYILGMLIIGGMSGYFWGEWFEIKVSRIT